MAEAAASQDAHLKGDSLKRVQLAFAGVLANARKRAKSVGAVKVAGEVTPPPVAPPTPSVTQAAMKPAPPVAAPAPAVAKQPYRSPWLSPAPNAQVQSYYHDNLDNALRGHLAKAGWTDELREQNQEAYNKAFEGARNAVGTNQTALRELHSGMDWKYANGTGAPNAAKDAGAELSGLGASARLIQGGLGRIGKNLTPAGALLAGGAAVSELGGSPTDGHHYGQQLLPYNEGQEYVNWLREQSANDPHLRHALEQSGLPAARFASEADYLADHHKNTAQQQAVAAVGSTGSTLALNGAGQAAAATPGLQLGTKLPWRQRLLTPLSEAASPAAEVAVPTTKLPQWPATPSQTGVWNGVKNVAGKVTGAVGRAVPLVGAGIQAGTALSDIDDRLKRDDVNEYDTHLDRLAAEHQANLDGKNGFMPFVGSAVNLATAPVRGDTDALASQAQQLYKAVGADKVSDAMVNSLSERGRTKTSEIVQQYLAQDKWFSQHPQPGNPGYESFLKRQAALQKDPAYYDRVAADYAAKHRG